MERRKMKINNTARFSLIFPIVMGASFFINKAYSQNKNLVVRIAKLQIDSGQLEVYKAALKEQISSAVSREPGVLTLYAVYEKENPTRVMVFEIYASQKDYEAHLQTLHFIKYKTQTKDMVKSLELINTVPIILEAKPKIPE